MFLCCAFVLEAQQLLDVVTLKDGTILRGAIQKELEGGLILKMKLENGKKAFLPMSDIESLSKEKTSSVYYESRSLFEADKKRVYLTAKAGLLMGTATWGRGFSTGLSSSVSTGYQFNQWLAIGVGAEVNSYNPAYNDTVFPFFGEIRGFFLDLPAADWFYNIRAGYGYIPRFQNEGRANGGLMLHPSVGFRFGKSPKVGYTFDFGVQLQNADYSSNDWNGRLDESVRYQRYALRFGFLF